MGETLALAADGLALHDVRADYVSPDVLSRLGPDFPAALVPAFSGCIYEWGILTASWWIRLALSAFLYAAFFCFANRELDRKRAAVSEAKAEPAGTADREVAADQEGGYPTSGGTGA